MKFFSALAALAATVGGSYAQEIPERDFACGGEIDYFCDGEKDVHACLEEHRHELGATCIFALLEHESLHCGIEVEVLCGKERTDKEKFHECIEKNYETLKKICPEETHFDRFDEIENIKCGFEVSE